MAQDRHRHLQCMTSHSPIHRRNFEWPWTTPEWLSEIFNDMKHRAASLRQLSFLFVSLYDPFRSVRCHEICFRRIIRRTRVQTHVWSTLVQLNRFIIRLCPPRQIRRTLTTRQQIFYIVAMKFLLYVTLATVMRLCNCVMTKSYFCIYDIFPFYYRNRNAT